MNSGSQTSKTSQTSQTPTNKKQNQSSSPDAVNMQFPTSTEVPLEDLSKLDHILTKLQCLPDIHQSIKEVGKDVAELKKSLEFSQGEIEQN